MIASNRTDLTFKIVELSLLRVTILHTVIIAELLW